MHAFSLNRDQRSRVAHFLEKQGFKRQALAVSADPEHRFDLAIALGELQTAYELAKQADNEDKWRQLSTAAAARSELPLAGECLGRAKDYGGLLLLATSAGSDKLMSKLASEASANGKTNVAFCASMLQGNVDECLRLLIATDRLPEAAMFARTYCPSQVEHVLDLWKQKVASKGSAKLAQALASPQQYPNLFPNIDDHTQAEKVPTLASNIPCRSGA